MPGIYRHRTALPLTGAMAGDPVRTTVPPTALLPTREDLLAEVYRRDVEELVTAAPRLLAPHRPLDALAAWFDRVATSALRCGHLDAARYGRSSSAPGLAGSARGVPLRAADR
jgi:hypothetical protein